MPHLPRSEAGRAHQVAARFNLHVLVVFSTDFAQLERGAHLAVQFILFLGERQTDIADTAQRRARVITATRNPTEDVQDKVNSQHKNKLQKRTEICKNFTGILCAGYIHQALKKTGFNLYQIFV